MAMMVKNRATPVIANKVKFSLQSRTQASLFRIKKGVKAAADKIKYTAVVKLIEELKIAFFKAGPTKENKKAAINTYLDPFSLIILIKGVKKLLPSFRFNRYAPRTTLIIPRAPIKEGSSPNTRKPVKMRNRGVKETNGNVLDNSAERIAFINNPTATTSAKEAIKIKG